jgi:D-ribose pyranase
MVFDRIYLAEEMKDKNPDMLLEFQSLFADVEIEFISHAELKRMAKSCRAVVRTGEFSAYSNCIFIAGCNF